MSQVHQANVSPQYQVVGNGRHARQVEFGGAEAALEVVRQLVQEWAEREPLAPCLEWGVSGITLTHD